MREAEWTIEGRGEEREVGEGREGRARQDVKRGNV